MAADLEGFYLHCKEVPVCDFAIMLQHQQTVQHACCVDDNCHGTLNPIAISECSPECGAVFEPFEPFEYLSYVIVGTMAEVGRRLPTARALVLESTYH